MKGNIETFEHAIFGLGNGGNFEMIENIYKEMKEANIQPNENIILSMLQSYGKVVD